MAVRAVRPANERGLRVFALPFSRVRELDPWRRVALAGALTVAVCSLAGIPDFGWLEASQLLVAVSCIRLLARPVETLPPPLPFHDGTLLAAGGMWAALIALANAWDHADIATEMIIVVGCGLLFVAGVVVRTTVDEDYWFE
ncbi:MAG: hypothetical protein ACRDKI_05430 [Solirubrobacterales bacterium]